MAIRLVTTGRHHFGVEALSYRPLPSSRPEATRATADVPARGVALHFGHPPHHSITSSARASTVAGISRPSALAVLRLITSSYFVGACTGRSAGLSPLRMQPT